MVTTTQQGIAARINEAITTHNNHRTEGDTEWNILWLAENSGLSRSTLNRKMADEDRFTIKDIAKISAALGLPPTDLASRYFARRMVSA